jgi:chromosome segregation ATPase
MDSIEQNNYTMVYVKRQENLLIEQIKKIIDLETQLTLSVPYIEQLKQKYDESQKQVEIQNEMMQQASRSIEDLTIKNKNFESQINNLNSTKIDLERSKNENIDSINQYSNRNNELERELKRINQEMQMIFDENILLKKQIEEIVPKKTINKKQSSDIIDDSAF